MRFFSDRTSENGKELNDIGTLQRPLANQSCVVANIFSSSDSDNTPTTTDLLRKRIGIDGTVVEEKKARCHSLVPLSFLNAFGHSQRRMSSKATADFISTEANFSPTSSSSRSKKLPPPPLCLPATTASTEDEKTAAAAQRRERKKSANQCCLPTSSDECPHPSAPYVRQHAVPAPAKSSLVLDSAGQPTAANPQDTDRLVVVAAHAPAVGKQIQTIVQRRLHEPIEFAQVRFRVDGRCHACSSRQLQPSAKATVNDNEWIDLMRFIVHKPLEDELKSLLDKYKMVTPPLFSPRETKLVFAFADVFRPGQRAQCLRRDDPLKPMRHRH